MTVLLVAFVCLIGIFFLLGVTFVAVIMNHYALSREVHVIHPGRYRKLTIPERKLQESPGMLYCTEEPTQVSFLHNGQRELVTIPIDRVFDGDSCKRICGLGNHGSAWVVHDWLYAKPHTVDSGVELWDRKHADELMYELLSHEGVVHMLYASLLRLFDSMVSTTLDRAWNDDSGSNVYVDSVADVVVVDRVDAI